MSLGTNEWWLLGWWCDECEVNDLSLVWRANTLQLLLDSNNWDDDDHDDINDMRVTKQER